MFNDFSCESRLYTELDYELRNLCDEFFEGYEWPTEATVRARNVTRIAKLLEQIDVHHGDLEDSYPKTLLQCLVYFNCCDEMEAVRLIAEKSYLPLNTIWDGDVITVCFKNIDKEAYAELLDAIFYTRRREFQRALALHERLCGFAMPTQAQCALWCDLLQRNLPPYLKQERPITALDCIDELETYLGVPLRVKQTSLQE